MKLYKNTKVKIRSPDGDTDFFDIVAGVLQGGNISPIAVHNLPGLRTSNVNRFNERKWLYFGKSKKQKIPHTITDVDYTDDIAFLANTPAQAESLLLELATRGIGLHANADKTDFMCDKRCDISTLNK